MKITYIDKKFSGKTVETIDQANRIIEEYEADGLSLTLRQIYYQFVSRGLIDNVQTEYKRLGSIISDGRLAGLIDWNAIVDRTRNLKSRPSWENPGEVIDSAKDSFKLDHWKNQKYHVEVWIEKEALVGVINKVCREFDVSYFACKGYVSQSELWRAARRAAYYQSLGKECVLLHLGDHDPSGIDMTRDINDRHSVFFTSVDLTRLALNMDQVKEYNPPPNPTKLSDSRSPGYVAKFGNNSWELDALEPRVLQRLISDTVREYRDEDLYQETMELQGEYINTLGVLAENWEDLIDKI